MVDWRSGLSGDDATSCVMASIGGLKHAPIPSRAVEESRVIPALLLRRNDLASVVPVSVGLLKAQMKSYTLVKDGASRDTRVSYGWCLLIQRYFCAV